MTTFHAVETYSNNPYVKKYVTLTTDEEIGGKGGVPEAPSDNNAYTRKNKAWEKLEIVDSLDSTASDKPISARAVNVDLVNYIDDSITATMLYIDQQDNSEHDGRVAGDNLLDARLSIIEGKAVEKIPIINTIPSTGMLADVFYALGIISADPNVTLAANPTDGKDHEYMLSFDTGSTVPTTITFPTSVVFPDTPTWEANKHYEISMKYNGSKYYAVVQSWAPMA